MSPVPHTPLRDPSHQSYTTLPTVTWSSSGASLSPRGPRLDWVILGSTLQVRGQTSRPLSVLHCVGSPRSLTMPLMVMWSCSAVSILPPHPGAALVLFSYMILGNS